MADALRAFAGRPLRPGLVLLLTDGYDPDGLRGGRRGAGRTRARSRAAAPAHPGGTRPTHSRRPAPRRCRNRRQARSDRRWRGAGRLPAAAGGLAGRTARARGQTRRSLRAVAHRSAAAARCCWTICGGRGLCSNELRVTGSRFQVGSD